MYENDENKPDRYENGLKQYRDLKNVIDTARDEGIMEVEIRGKLEAARKMKEKGFSTADIIEITGLSESEMENL